MDRLQAMQCFVRVVKLGSFSAAAEELSCSNATVSKYVKHLEDWTQSLLLLRSTRSLQLTEAGQIFYDYCLRVEQETSELHDQINQDRQQVAGRLVLSAPVSLTLTLLGPLLLDFQSKNPQLQLEIRLSDSPVDLVRDGIDLALRASVALDDSSLVAIPMMPLQRVVVATPAYLLRHSQPQRLDDLDQHNCLIYSRGSDANDWEFSVGNVIRSVRVRGSLSVDNSLLLIQALLNDMGIGLVPRVMVERELAAGILVPVLSDWPPIARTLHAIYPNRQYLPRRVSDLISYLKTHLAHL